MGGGIKVGPFGGKGDQPFDMGLADHLVGIKVRHGGAIDAITVTYDLDGQVYTSPRYGGAGGEESLITFDPGDYLSEITGYFGLAGNATVVRSLTFKTNLGKTYGPYGIKEGTLFSVPVVNGKIISFFGHYGKYLNAVGASMVLN